jgi:hypothetical protein
MLEKAEPQKPQLSAFQQAHLGAITASNAHRISRDKSGKGWSQTALTFAAQIVHEHATRQPYGEFEGNENTEFGHEHEEKAVQLVAEWWGAEILHRGEFVKMKHAQLIGATPDAVAHDGLRVFTVEVKCPPKRHAQILVSAQVPADYRAQMLFQQCVTGFKFSAFATYNPNFNYCPFKTFWFEPSEEERAEYRAKLLDFEGFVLGRMERLEIPVLEKFRAK